MEWFNSIREWFVIHKDEIVTFVTSSSFVGFVTTIIMLVKQAKGIKANTAATDNLNGTVTAITDLTNTVDGSLKENLSAQQEIKVEQNQLKSELGELKSDLSNLLAKVNAMLDVQQVVYSTLKDEQIRKTVNDLLINAKFAETEQRAQLKEKLAQLEELIKAHSKEVDKQVEETVEEAKAIVDAVSDVVTRY